MVAQRFGVYLVALDPTIGAEIKKTRPCAVVSPDEMNRHLRTSIVAPLTTMQRRFPTRVACRFQGKSSEIALDQIRTVDQSRLVKRLGTLEATTARKALRVLGEM